MIPTPRSAQRGKLAVEHVLLEQGVAHRQQEEVHVEQIEEAWNAAYRVKARADPADDPGLRAIPRALSIRSS